MEGVFMYMYADYLIVGAGAAGCTLAWLLRQTGGDVLLLELLDFQTKEKLCGGVLGDDAFRMIETIFGPDAIEELSPVHPLLLRSRCLDWEIRTAAPYVTLPRRRLDDWLFARCMETGARALDRIRIESIDSEEHVAECTDLRKNKEIRIKYGEVIGADGANSLVRRLLSGSRQRLALSFECISLKVCDDIIFEYYPSRVGYCWHIPIGEIANVGCGMYEGNASDVKKQLYDFCDEFGIVPSHMRGAPIPSGDDMMLRIGKDAWLVGDAAGLACPVDGGGIHYALISAHRLAASFQGGMPYEESMSQVTKNIAQMAAMRGVWYLSTMSDITQNGKIWK